MANYSFKIEWKGRGFQWWNAVLMIHEVAGEHRA